MSDGINRRGPATAVATATATKSMGRLRCRAAVLALLGALVLLAALPGGAQAHGPVDPVATSYLATIGSVPAGLDAKVVDGDVRLWLRVPSDETAVVLDYAGAPYVRFAGSGVDVNVNSAMYYLNQTPAELPPAKVSPAVPPKWQRVSAGHGYRWHDGRLQALARIALSPGTRYVGKWSIPMTIDGRSTSISGDVLHAENPSIVWFWPIFVLLACVVAAWRLERPALDARLARGLAITALIATAVGSAARELHGRPTVSPGQLITLAILVAFVAWGLRRVLLGPPGFFVCWAISGVALWTGLVLVPTLSHGYVLLAVPAFVARATVVLCLASGAGLLWLSLRMTGRSKKGSATPDRADDWEIEDDRAESWA
jgi:hypothetical protein